MVIPVIERSGNQLASVDFKETRAFVRDRMYWGSWDRTSLFFVFLCAGHSSSLIMYRFLIATHCKQVGYRNSFTRLVCFMGIICYGNTPKSWDMTSDMI